MKENLIILSDSDFTKAKPITTSLIIAEIFEKEHKNVLADIRKLDCSKQFNALNFKLVKYVDKKNEERPYYTITRDGFMFLVMGYKGKKAAQFKENFIKAFNLMEKELLRRQETRLIGTKIYRRNITDMIQYINSGEDIDNFVKFSYSIYTDLIYKKCFGKTTKQLRIERHIPSNKNIRDFLTVEELEQVQDIEDKVRRKCIKEGWIKLKPTVAYQKVKEFLQLDN